MAARLVSSWQGQQRCQQAAGSGARSSRSTSNLCMAASHGFRSLDHLRMHQRACSGEGTTLHLAHVAYPCECCIAAAGDLVIPSQGAAAQPDAEEQQQPQQRQQKGKKRKELEAGSPAAADGEQPEAAAAKNKSKKQKGKVAKSGTEGGEAGDAGAGDGGATGSEAAAADDAASVAALKAQLAALAAENKLLKRQQKKEARQEKRAAAAAKRKEERAARRAAAAEAAAAQAAAAAAAAASVDISAWKDLQLHPLIEKAIAALGFEAPTHVQAECLPAAIRDRRDVIGAAQTGSGKTLAFGLPIMQLLLQERAAEGAAGAAGSAAGSQEEGAAAGGAAAAGEAGMAARQPSKLRALILAPTRELALQVCEHLQARTGWCSSQWVCQVPQGGRQCVGDAKHSCVPAARHLLAQCFPPGQHSSAPKAAWTNLAQNQSTSQCWAGPARCGFCVRLAPLPTAALHAPVLQAVGKACGVWVVPIVGGISALKQERLLCKSPEVRARPLSIPQPPTHATQTPPPPPRIPSVCPPARCLG